MSLRAAPSDLARHVARRLPIGLLIGVVLVQYNIWPGVLPNPASFLLFSGNSVCLANEFPNLDFACDANGYPSGLVVVFGYPFVWLTGAVHRLSPLGIENSFRVVWGVTLVIALYGARRLFGLVTTTAWIAWAAAGIFLLSPIVSHQSGYGPLQLGFALVPAYLLVDVWFMRCLDERRHVAVAAAAVVALRTFALFTDGYSFVMSMIPVAVMYALWGFRRVRLRGHGRTVLVGALTFVASTAIAGLLYTWFVGVDEFAATPIDFFRGQGVDLFALAVPPPSNWWAKIVGLHHSLDPSQAYSDGRNINDVYLGWCLVAAAVGGAIVAIRQQLTSKVVAATGVGGVVGFLLALGPSLKIADFRPSQSFAAGVPAFRDYLMPMSAATMSTGWGWLYRHVPGVDTMRALYRWELLVRLSLLVLAVVAVAALARRGRHLVALAVVVAVAVESMPAPQHREGVEAQHVVERFTADVVEPLAALVRPGERAVLVNPAPGAGETNFYVANWMCPMLRLRCYNVGGDKGAALAAEHQSAVARRVMFSTENLGAELAALFESGDVDVVIFVDFNMRTSAYVWPPAPGVREVAAAAGQAVLDAASYNATAVEWATVVRPSFEVATSGDTG